MANQEAKIQLTKGDEKNRSKGSLILTSPSGANENEEDAINT
jgi:hypothetical protein